MKRIAVLFLGLALCLGLAVPALAAEEASPAEAHVYAVKPENAGMILGGAQELNAVVEMNFQRSGSNNSHITYAPTLVTDRMAAAPVPKGLDLVVTGASADEVRLRALSVVAMEEGSLSGGTALLYRLFTWESGKEASLVPLGEGDPLKFAYDDPMDGKTQVGGNITAADAGFQVNQDGDVVIDSQRLYEMLDEGDLFQILIGDACWLYQLSGEPTLVSNVFTDVETGKWFSDPVAWAWAGDIAAGKTETGFAPGDECTQAQILTFLYRAEREEAVKASAKDMELAVAWAKEQGMIDDSFDGNTPCTRAAAVHYIWQAKGQPAAAASSFTDVDANAAYAKAVDWANETKITTGTGDGTRFEPNTVCSRAYIVTFLYRAYNS